ncbi:hypothetical protein [Kluyvera ascorbata]|uniref:hypothetical protein n=1 Tax=Kluyvera ascorbata TaxID=51288 RepID=UPI0039F49DE1
MSYLDEVILWDGPYGVAVTSAAPTERTMIEVGTTDVPAGKPFWVVNITDLPTGSPPEEWVIADIVNGRDPDGIGTSN